VKDIIVDGTSVSVVVICCELFVGYSSVRSLDVLRLHGAAGSAVVSDL